MYLYHYYKTRTKVVYNRQNLIDKNLKEKDIIEKFFFYTKMTLCDLCGQSSSDEKFVPFLLL